MPTSLTFLYPHAAWLLLLMPLLWRVAPTRRVGHAVLRAATLLCLVIACMQPTLIHRSGVAPQVYVVDQRDDLAPQSRTAIRAALERRLAASPRGHRLLVQLGGPPIAAAVDERQMLPGGSLTAGLAAALQSLPPGTGEITLITDGRSTDRHWERQVTAMIDRGVPVDTIRLDDPVRHAFIGGVEAAPVRVGEIATVTVAVGGDGRDHLLSLISGDREMARMTVSGEGQSDVALRFPADRAGFLPLRATLSDGGQEAGKAIDTVLAVQDPLRLLYLGSRQAGAGAVLQRLLGHGFVIDARNPATLGAGFDFARYPLVMLDDVPSAQLPAAVQHGLAGAVANDDTGLLVSGGDAVFGGGGYATRPLGPALPVLPRPEEKVEQPSAGVVIVIDTSGSMHGARLDNAKQMARRIADKLKPTDQIGILEFYGARQWTVPLQPATDIDAVGRAVSRLQASGSDDLLPALEDAYYALKGINTRYKNIVVISDGELQPNRYDQLLGRIAQDRINVSTVQTGDDPEGAENMSRWARIGHGRFYAVNDEFSLVSIDFKQPQIKPQPGYRPGAYPLRDDAGPLWWRDAGVTAVPPLDGYTRTRARPAAQTLLATAAGDPVLASWQVGGGRVTALTTEPLGAGSRSWQGWRQYGQWLGRVAGLTARQRPDLSITPARRFDRMAITVQRLDGRGRAMPELRLVDFNGRNAPLPVALEERAPGLFAGDFAFASNRPALVEAQDDDGKIIRVADRAGSDISPAGAVLPSLALPLARLSALTGGRHDGPDNAGTAPPSRAGGLAAIDLWPWLVLLALFLYLFDLFHRRTPRRGGLRTGTA